MKSYSEELLEGRVVVNVYTGRRRLSDGRTYDGPIISIGSFKNLAGSMSLTPLELAALLDGPLERALEKANA